jgi:hypothetical protein
MIARFDHRPMLTALLALSTTVLVVVVIMLSALLITSAPQAASPPSIGSGNPGAGAAPANMDAGGESYGWNVQPRPAHHGNPAAADPKVMDGGSYGEVYGWDIHK